MSSRAEAERVGLNMWAEARVQLQGFIASSACLLHPTSCLCASSMDSANSQAV
jgi:hypothetical protein